jgi:surface polysaccharide O-acyltransferase-like enzyme
MAWNFKAINTLLTSWVNLLIAPKQSEVTFLWYIYLLFIFYCISPFIFNAKRWVKVLLFIGAIYLSTHVIPVGYLCIDWFTRYFVFFLLGAYIAEHYTQIKQFDIRWSILALIAFFTISVVHFKNGYNPILEYTIQMIGIPAIACISWILMKWTAARKTLVYISVNCFGIYLLHMFFVQAGAMIITRLPFNIPSYGYIIYLIVSTTLSIFATAIIWEPFNKKQKIKLSNIIR